MDIEKVRKSIEAFENDRLMRSMMLVLGDGLRLTHYRTPVDVRVRLIDENGSAASHVTDEMFSDTRNTVLYAREHEVDFKDVTCYKTLTTALSCDDDGSVSYSCDMVKSCVLTKRHGYKLNGFTRDMCRDVDDQREPFSGKAWSYVLDAADVVRIESSSYVPGEIDWNML